MAPSSSRRGSLGSSLIDQQNRLRRVMPHYKMRKNTSQQHARQRARHNQTKSRPDMAKRPKNVPQLRVLPTRIRKSTVKRWTRPRRSRQNQICVSHHQSIQRKANSASGRRRKAAASRQAPAEAILRVPPRSRLRPAKKRLGARGRSARAPRQGLAQREGEPERISSSALTGVVSDTERGALGSMLRLAGGHAQCD